MEKGHKFNVGDKVRILDGKEIPNYYGGWFSYNMGQLVGKCGYVKKYTIVHTNGRVYYELKGKVGRNRNTRFVFDERGLELIKSVRRDEKGEKPTVEKEKQEKEKEKKNSLRFKVGDRVMLKDNLFIENYYGGISYLKDMEKCKKKIGEVKSITERGNYQVVFVDKNGNLFDTWYLSDEMLKKIEGKREGEEKRKEKREKPAAASTKRVEMELPSPRFQVGDKVRVKEGLEHGFYDGVLFSRSMKEYEGVIFTVQNVFSQWNREDDKWHYRYQLVGKALWYNWSEEMLTEVEGGNRIQRR